MEYPDLNQHNRKAYTLTKSSVHKEKPTYVPKAQVGIVEKNITKRPICKETQNKVHHESGPTDTTLTMNNFIYLKWVVAPQ